MSCGGRSISLLANPATSHFGGGGGEFCDGDCLDSDDAAGRFRIVGIISNCADCQSATSEKEVQCRFGELKAMGGALHESSDDVLLIYIYIYVECRWMAGALCVDLIDTNLAHLCHSAQLFQREYSVGSFNVHK